MRPKSVTNIEPIMPVRRTLLKAGGTLLLSVLSTMPSFAAQILAVRVWPADDYTRVTLENDRKLKATHFVVKNPERLVVDIEGLELSATLKELVAKVQSDDPYIRNVRVGQNRPNVIRLVFDLKSEVAPQVFELAPVGEYRHRLVFDLYPKESNEKILEPVTGANSGEIAIPKDKQIERELPQVVEKNHPKAKPETQKQTTQSNVSRLITIALDPGHGGEDPGAVGKGGSKEKDVVLSIAKRLKNKLEESKNIRVILTRDGDYFVPLHVRVRKARKAQADLFVSIHADAWIEPDARGSSVFALSEKGASSTAARWLANKENSADLIGGINIKSKDRQLASILLDLSTTAQIKDSLKLAKAVLGEIGGINKLHKGSVEQAGFAVLKAPDIPSILVETAFISNPEEEAKLTDYFYQDRMAEAIARGIESYFSKNPPLSKNKLY